MFGRSGVVHDHGSDVSSGPIVREFGAKPGLAGDESDCTYSCKRKELLELDVFPVVRVFTDIALEGQTSEGGDTEGFRDTVRGDQEGEGSLGD